jgi:hypothetical protein
MNNGYDEPRAQSILLRTLVRVSQNKGKHKGTYQTNLTKQQHKKVVFCVLALKSDISVL